MHAPATARATFDRTNISMQSFLPHTEFEEYQEKIPLSSRLNHQHCIRLQRPPDKLVGRQQSDPRIKHINVTCTHALANTLATTADKRRALTTARRTDKKQTMFKMCFIIGTPISITWVATETKYQIKEDQWRNTKQHKQTEWLNSKLIYIM